jgi:hypothetical protein
MNSSAEAAPNQKNGALWTTVIVEAVVIVAIGAYNLYEIRRTSELLQDKIQGLANYSARQGEKLDRMTTALELYVGKSFSTNDATLTNSATADQRIEKAIKFLEAWKAKDEKVQPVTESNR